MLDISVPSQEYCDENSLPALRADQARSKDHLQRLADGKFIALDDEQTTKTRIPSTPPENHSID